MKVTINYKGQIATEAGQTIEELSFDEPVALIDLLQTLSSKAADAVGDFIFDDEGAPRRSLLIVINEEQVIDFHNTLIKEDCVISLLPPIAGG